LCRSRIYVLKHNISYLLQCLCPFTEIYHFTRKSYISISPQQIYVLSFCALNNFHLFWLLQCPTVNVDVIYSCFMLTFSISALILRKPEEHYSCRLYQCLYCCLPLSFGSCRYNETLQFLTDHTALSVHFSTNFALYKNLNPSAM